MAKSKYRSIPWSPIEDKVLGAVRVSPVEPLTLRSYQRALEWRVKKMIEAVNQEELREYLADREKVGLLDAAENSELLAENLVERALAQLPFQERVASKEKPLQPTPGAGTVLKETLLWEWMSEVKDL